MDPLSKNFVPVFLAVAGWTLNLFCSQGNVMVGIVILFLAAEDSAPGHCLHTEAHNWL